MQKLIGFISKNKKERKIIILLVSGDKSKQQKDIDKAKDIFKKINK